MEMTPSLACANKCVFCWRHHSNPVGKEWKWQLDEPEFIIEQGVENHLAMIRQMKGVPGVRKERLDDAATIRHCALSLVGEPIMYPHINRFVDLLHARGISTFLVTNAQFPDRIRDLQPVTQLYVSVDASTPEALKAVDRPLFKDYWERFLASLEAIGKKQTRTVYRLTLIKAWNMEEIANYASLIVRGTPEFIEIKGVTFCGASDASSLTMKNVPFHHEVLHFAQELLKYIAEDYEIACEHAHSCMIVIAHKKFRIDGAWHTWIDYDKFHALIAEGRPFTSLEYAARTPDWAVWGAAEAGFDPAEERVYVKGAKKRELSQAGGASDAGSVAGDHHDQLELDVDAVNGGC
jgi:tRNA wybutosine-synthesizing protein 1